MKKLLLIITLIRPLTGFGQHKTDSQLIEQVRTDWTVYIHNKQLDKAVNQYTDDAVFYSPDGQNAKGKKEITKLYRFVMKQYNSQLYFHSAGVIISGDVAGDSGDFNETMLDNTTHKTMNLKGSYMMVLQKKHAGWKINRIMWTAGK